MAHPPPPMRLKRKESWYSRYAPRAHQDIPYNYHDSLRASPTEGIHRMGLIIKSTQFELAKPGLQLRRISGFCSLFLLRDRKIPSAKTSSDFHGIPERIPSVKHTNKREKQNGRGRSVFCAISVDKSLREIWNSET